MLLLVYYFFFFFNCSDLASDFVLAFDSEVLFQVLIFLLSHGILDLKNTQKSIIYWKRKLSNSCNLYLVLLSSTFFRLHIVFSFINWMGEPHFDASQWCFAHALQSWGAPRWEPAYLLFVPSTWMAIRPLSFSLTPTVHWAQSWKINNAQGKEVWQKNQASIMDVMAIKT